MLLGEYTLLVVVLAALGVLVLRTADPVPPESQIVVRRPAGRDVPRAPDPGRRTALPLLPRQHVLALPSGGGGLGVGAVGRSEVCSAAGPRRRMESAPAIPATGLTAPPGSYAPVGVAPALAPPPPAAVAPVVFERPGAATPDAGKLVAFTVVVPMERLDGRRARLSLTLE